MSGGGPQPPFDAAALHREVMAGHVTGVQAGLDGMAEADRRALSPQLLATVEEMARDWHGGGAAVSQAALVAVVGCAPTAAKASALACHHLLVRHWNRTAARLVFVTARARGVEWLPDFAVRLAAYLPGDASIAKWDMVGLLLRATGAPFPTTDRYVRTWLATVPDSSADDTAARLREDPWLDAMLPRLFDIDGLGRQPETSRVTAALVPLSHTGRADREVLLDGCLARFLRGDRPAALRPFGRLHDELAPTVAEVAARRTDYLRLLAGTQSTMVARAQKALQAVDSDDGLDADGLTAVLAASDPILQGAEKGLARTQLAWLDRLARRHRDRTDEILATVGTATANPHLDIQDKARDIVARHRPAAAGSASDPTPAVSAAIHAVDRTWPEPEPATAAEQLMPAPIGSADELAEEAAALPESSADPVTIERIVDALVRLTAADRAATSAALRPVADRYPWLPAGAVGLVMAAIVNNARARAFATAEHKSRWPGPAQATGALWPGWTPHYWLKARFAEIAVRLHTDRAPCLLATPTHANGLLDPEVLLDRMEQAERKGWRPWPRDLTQALLRLPRDAGPAAIKRAQALTSDDGRRIARWLEAGGAPEPVARRVEVEHHEQDDRLPPWRALVQLTPAAGHDRPHRLFGLQPLDRVRARSLATDVALWPAAAPAYREVIAAHAVEHVATMADVTGNRDSDGTEVVPLLAGCPGPMGPAFALLLAYALGAGTTVGRVSAVDALVTAASTGGLRPAAVGAEVGLLTVGGAYPLSRAVRAFGNLAAADPQPYLWKLTAAVLQEVLPERSPPPGTPDLLALAARLAAQPMTRPGAENDGPATIPGLDGLAARTGSTRLVTEARRLARVLAGGAP